MDLYTKLRLVILGTFLSHIFVLNECRKLDGYKFPVYTTAFCPRNETEWKIRSSFMNCTTKNGYTCLPNKNLTELLEFCFKQPFIWIQEGVCLYVVDHELRLQAYNCSSFRYGCNNSAYTSDRIFEYPACITVGNGCFLAEPSCESTPTTVYDRDTTENMQTEDHLNIKKNDWVWIITLAGVVFFICVPFFLLYMWCIFLKKRRKSQSHDSEEFPLMIVDQTYKEMECTEIEKNSGKSKITIGHHTDKEYHIPKDEMNVDNCKPHIFYQFPNEKHQYNKDSNNEEKIDESIFDKWREDNKCFFSTRACEEVKKAIENQSLVIVIGHPGLGKTAIIKNIALEYREDGWVVKSVKRIGEIINVIFTIEKKTLYVFDDPIGRQNIDDSLYESWIINEEKLMSSLKKAKKVKILLSCRKYMFSNDVKKYFGNESNIVDISDEQLKLNNGEKREILNRYLSCTNINVSEDALVGVENIELYFPLLCYLYSTNKQWQEKGLHFFTEYKTDFQKDIENFKINDNLKYCALVLLVVFNNEICVDDLLANEKSEAKFQRILKVCTMDTRITPSKIGSTLDSLAGFFVMKEDYTYQFSHDLVMQITAEEFLNNHPSEFIQYVDTAYLRKMVKLDNFDNDSNQFAICLSDKYVDKLAERLFSDLSGDSCLDIVLNPCLKNKKVIKKIKKIIKKENQETLQMLLDKKKLEIDNQKLNEPTKKLLFTRLFFVESEIEVTPLFALIAFGHTELSQYCLKHLQEMQINIEGNSLLTAVCCNGSIDLFNFIYKGETEKLKTEEYKHLSPIHIVSVFHNFILLEELIKYGFDVNLKSGIEGKWTPLVLAAGNDTEENQYYNDGMSSDIRRDKTVKLLLDKKADINLRTDHGFSPFASACRNGHYSTVKLLYSYGANVKLCDKEGLSPLYFACSEGHCSIVDFLLCHNDVDINLCSGIGHSPLCAACFDGHESIVTLLLSKGADVNLSMKNGLSPLYVACSFGHFGTVNILLNYEADLELPDSEGKTPLCAACFDGHNNIVRLLCEKGANVNLVEKEGFSPLLIACQNGHYGTVELLLQNKAEINLCTKNGFSPLFIACHKGHEVIVKHLLDKRADVDLCNQNGISPLMKACENNNERIVQILLEFEANINLCDQNGISPLCLACLYDKYLIVELLLEHKADVNLYKNDGASPLYAACQNGHCKVIDLLLRYNADINLCGKYGNSPLIVACLNGHYTVVKKLLDNKANPNLCTKTGMSPLYISCKKGYDSIVELLLSEGSEINLCTNTSGASPLFIACTIGHYNIVDILLQKSADINACLNDGTSPLYIACQEGHYGIVKRLIDKQAKIDLCMNDGFSPLHGACYGGHDRIAQLLLNNNAEINSKKEIGISPLYIAFRWRHDETVQLLLKNGADPSLVNGCEINFSSLDWFNEKDITVEFLLRKDNINNNIHDPDSFFSLFVFCQIENARRIRMSFKKPHNL